MRRSTRWTAAGIFLVALLVSGDAQAFPWFVREGYTHCAQCHADPSGSGLLTQYGRAQGELLLRSRYGFDDDSGEPARVGGFLFGAFELPDFLLLGGDLRNGLLRVVVTPPGGPAIATNRLLQMQADVRGQVALGPVRVHGSLGFAHEEAELTQVTAQLENNLVAREYWVGYDANEEFLVRLGRFTLPFGLRSNEHTMWVRQAVQDTTRDGQQTGLAAAYNHESLRTEVMAFIGNFGPFSTIYTTQGASGYAELTLGEHAAVGISALVSHTTSAQAIDSMRQAYGAFGRWSPVYPLVLMAEFDALLNKIGQNDGAAGYVGLLQADVQIIQGVHVLVAGEIQGPPGAADGAPQLSGWGGVGWFCLPHTDVRIDGTLQRLPSPNGAVSAASLLGQLHIYL